MAPVISGRQRLLSGAAPHHDVGVKLAGGPPGNTPSVAKMVAVAPRHPAGAAPPKNSVMPPAIARQRPLPRSPPRHDADAKGVHVPWRERPLLNLASAAEIIDCSRAHIYTLEKERRIRLVKLNRRTLVETQSLIAFLATAQPYVSAGPVGRAKRRPARHDA